MSRNLAWTDAAWSDYVYWQGQDKKTLKRINTLIRDVLRTPFAGIGKPEALKENLSGVLVSENRRNTPARLRRDRYPCDDHCLPVSLRLSRLKRATRRA